MSSCSWSGLAFGMDTEAERERPNCKLVCGGSNLLQPQLDPFLLLVLIVGSIFWHQNQISTAKRKLDKLKHYIDHETKHSPTVLDENQVDTLSKNLEKFDSTLKEIGEKFSGLDLYSKENSKTKLQFPHFTGFGPQPIEWLNRAGQFFKYHEILENQKVSLASFYLEGEANQWLQWIQKMYQQDGKELTWDIFKKEMVSRFGSAEEEDYRESLSRMKQTGSLKEYRCEFERLCNRVVDVPNTDLIRTFIGGLKEELTSDINISDPKTIHEAIEIARTRDELLSRQRRSSSSGYASST